MKTTVTQLLTHSRPTLTAAEELTLFRRLRAKMRVVDDVNALETRSKRDLCRRWHAERNVERDLTHAVEANLPLVVAMAKRVKYKCVDFDELVAEGNLTLLRCARLFDPERGFKFSTYCARALFKTFGALGRRESKHYKSRESEWVHPGSYTPKEDVAADVRDVIEIALEPDEAAVLRCRRGIGHPSPMNVADTAVALKMSKRGVMRLYESGLPKLRAELEERGFTC